MAATICVFALLVIVFVSQSARFDRAYLNGPIVLLAAGGILGLTLVDPVAHGEAIRTLAEVTLVLVLFHDAAELQPRELRADSAFTARLLLVGLPLTIGAGFLLAEALFPRSMFGSHCCSRPPLRRPTRVSAQPRCSTPWSRHGCAASSMSRAV